MKYLLDTNVVIELLRGTSPALDRRVFRHAVTEIAISAVVLHELYYGAFKSALQSQSVTAVDALHFHVLGFGKEDARHAGEVRALHATRGTPSVPSTS